MPRSDIRGHFKKIDDLLKEIDKFAPAGMAYQSTSFRSDLAGLIVVAVVATYETCVKEIISSYAHSKNQDFGKFAERNFERLNSKIKSGDLYKYCALFDKHISDKFKNNIDIKKSKLLNKTRHDIVVCYDQIFTWRHGFAHAWNKNMTIEEVVLMHKFGKRVIYAFELAFEPKVISKAK